MAKARSSFPKFKQIRNTVENTILKTARSNVKSMANLAREDLVRRIRNQRFKSFSQEPLSQSWLEAKAKHGLDSRTMIATGNYIDSIKVIKIDDNNYFVGFEEDDKVVRYNPKTEAVETTNIPLTTLAKWHEFGTKTMPKRPHWRPTMRRIKDYSRQVRKDMGRVTVTELRRRLRRNKPKV